MISSDFLRLTCLGFSLAALGCAAPKMQFSEDGEPKEQRSLLGWKPPAVRYRESGDDEPIRDVKDPTRIQVSYARWMYEVGKQDVAQEQFQQILNRHPQCVDAMVGLAQCEMAAGRIENAEKRLREAVQTDPQSSTAHLALGQFLISQQRTQEGLDSLHQAVTAAPLDRETRFQLAVALAKSGQVDASIPHFTQAIGDAEGHYNIGLILFEAQDLIGAEEHLRIALTKNPKLQQAEQQLLVVEQALREGGHTVAQADGDQDVEETPVIRVAYSETHQPSLSPKQIADIKARQSPGK